MNDRPNDDQATVEQRVLCNDCRHGWIGFYLPQPIAIAALMLKNLTCPKCGAGARRITLDKAAG